MKNRFKLQTFDTSEHLVENLAGRIVKDLATAIKKNGKAVLAVSGGSTPKKLFRYLSQMELEWNRVCITLVDERWVGTDKNESNQKLVIENLLQNKAIIARLVSLKNNVIDVRDAQLMTQNRMKKLAKLDVVVLGMGEDAHTASFFPHATNLEELYTTDKLCCATEANVEPKERMTLTKNFLLSCDSLLLHIEGKKKKEVFEKATQSEDAFEMPIVTMMQQNQVMLEVYHA